MRSSSSGSAQADRARGPAHVAEIRPARQRRGQRAPRRRDVAGRDLGVGQAHAQLRVGRILGDQPAELGARAREVALREQHARQVGAQIFAIGIERETPAHQRRRAVEIAARAHAIDRHARVGVAGREPIDQRRLRAQIAPILGAMKQRRDHRAGRARDRPGLRRRAVERAIGVPLQPARAQRGREQDLGHPPRRRGARRALRLLDGVARVIGVELQLGEQVRHARRAGIVLGGGAQERARGVAREARRSRHVAARDRRRQRRARRRSVLRAPSDVSAASARSLSPRRSATKARA